MKNTIYKFLAACMAVCFLIACPSQSNTNDANQNPINNTDPNVKTYTLADLEQARTEGKCWTAINGNVYEIRFYLFASGWQHYQ